MHAPVSAPFRRSVDHIYLNGILSPADQAALSPFDRGFLFGDGLFDTIRVYRGRAHLLRRHLRRLISGLDFLDIAHPSEDEFADAVRRTIVANDIWSGALRLTVTRGVGGAMGEPELAEGPTVLITSRALAPEGTYEDGEQVITLGIRHTEPQLGRRLKSLNYLPAVYAARELAAAGVREGLLLSSDGTVAEGTVSNVFCVVQGRLLTPPPALGILPGVTRERVIELAENEGLEVRQEMFDHEMLVHAEECFYTNSVREVVPVVRVDDRTIGDGRPGPHTVRLRDAYRREAPNEML